MIYTGDNGSPHDVCTMFHQHNEICGGKGKTNDRGTHVPLIVQQPGTVPAGSVNDDLIDVTDFLPTMPGCGRSRRRLMGTLWTVSRSTRS